MLDVRNKVRSMLLLDSEGTVKLTLPSCDQKFMEFLRFIDWLLCQHNQVVFMVKSFFLN